MEGQVKHEACGTYWILFLQPLPEAGERIAVALVFRDIGGRPRVEFDRQLSKALRMYPDLDRDSLVFYLDSLQRELHSSHDVEVTLRSYGPQISTSSPRQIASPISEKIIKMLVAKYVRPARPTLNVSSFASASGHAEARPQASILFPVPEIMKQQRPLQSLVEQRQPAFLGLTA